jgi:hypothetical protein
MSNDTHEDAVKLALIVSEMYLRCVTEENLEIAAAYARRILAAQVTE